MGADRPAEPAGTRFANVSCGKERIMGFPQRADPREQLANLRKTLALVPNEKDKASVEMLTGVIEEQVGKLPKCPDGNEHQPRAIAAVGAASRGASVGT
jgi:hypothetical protein